MSLIYRFKKFLSYQWRAKSKYYLHSPFVYQFYLHALEGIDDSTLLPIQKLRTELRANEQAIQLNDFGTGSKREITVSRLEQQVAVRHQYGQLLFALVKYCQPKTILEIGTSIGLSAAYMALGQPAAKIISLEGSKDIAEVARRNHRHLLLTNIEIITGEFGSSLPQVLPQFNSLDMVFFDGNHTQKSTLAYFHACLEKINEKTVFVFDDIYWNEEMTNAWNEIKAHPQITLTIDVFQFGICFFRKDKLAKEDFVLRY